MQVQFNQNQGCGGCLEQLVGLGALFLAVIFFLSICRMIG